MQPSLAGGNYLRGEEKKQTSRCNLGVKWMVGIAAFAAIAFIRRHALGGDQFFGNHEAISDRLGRAEPSTKQLPLSSPGCAAQTEAIRLSNAGREPQRRLLTRRDYLYWPPLRFKRVASCVGEVDPPP